jgi:2-oxoglutarate dehydrogenase E2 component (dihydrolipoamide succinyltransferase)
MDTSFQTSLASTGKKCLHLPSFTMLAICNASKVEVYTFSFLAAVLANFSSKPKERSLFNRSSSNDIRNEKKFFARHCHSSSSCRVGGSVCVCGFDREKAKVSMYVIGRLRSAIQTGLVRGKECKKDLGLRWIASNEASCGTSDLKGATKLPFYLRRLAYFSTHSVSQHSFRLCSNHSVSPVDIRSLSRSHQSARTRALTTEASQESKQDAISIKVPQMGESIKEGTLISWQKSVGDAVEMDEVIAQIETDKVTVEVRAPESGTIVEELVKAGDNVAVGAEIARLKPGAVSEGGESEPQESETPSSTQQVSSSPVSIKVPEMGESIKEGTLVQWSKSEGDFVDMDEVIAQVETDKVTVEIRAPQMGILQKRKANQGDVVKVGSEIAALQPSSEPPKKEASKSDVESSVKSEPMSSKVQQPEKQSTPPSSPPKPPQQVFETSKQSFVGSEVGVKRVAMTRMRRRIAERLKEAQNTAAMLTTFNEVDMSALMELRNSYKEAFEKKHGIRLGFMSAFTKAATLALLEQPELNAYIDGSDIVYHDYVDISVAVSAPTGLVVPVIRNCQNLNFAEIEKAIHKLGEQARLGKLTIQDMQVSILSESMPSYSND